MLRERAHLSQAVLPVTLNLTVGYGSQLERGIKQPKGPALTLLNLIRYKGFEAIVQVRGHVRISFKGLFPGRLISIPDAAIRWRAAAVTATATCFPI